MLTFEKVRWLIQISPNHFFSKNGSRNQIENIEKRDDLLEEPLSEVVPQAAKLIAEEVDTQINLSSQPSIQAHSRGYGLVGDSVIVIDTAQDKQGNNFYQVKFDASGIEGWVESKFVKFWNLDEALIQLSRLSKNQVKELLRLDGARVEGGEAGNGIFRVVLPGYLPNNYKLQKFSVENTSRKTESGAYTTLSGYYLTYVNSSNSCFTVSAYVPPAGVPVGTENIEVYAPSIGNLLLSYTKFDTYTGQATIQLDGFTGQPNGYIYDVFSPGNPTAGSDLKCSTANLKEIIKVVESLRFINP
nr:MAG: SH3 domain-containing protein [Leptolyngbya sp. IPPAS B-1204]